MWVIAGLLFGVNLTIYGVASVIRWATYIQGALLVITSVAFMDKLPGMLWSFVDWCHGVNDKYKIITAYHEVNDFNQVFPEGDDIFDYEMSEMSDAKKAEEFVLAIERELTQKKPDDTSPEKYLLSVEQTLREKLPPGISESEHREAIRASMSDDEKVRFDALYMALDYVETARIILERKVPKTGV
jgi:hypothetical protein